MTRKLDPGAIVLGTAIPKMRAEVRAVKRERAVTRVYWERMVDDFRDCWKRLHGDTLFEV